MKLYNSENNVGLKNAWNIIQAEVTLFLIRKEIAVWPQRLPQSVKCSIHAQSKRWLMQAVREHSEMHNRSVLCKVKDALCLRFSIPFI